MVLTGDVLKRILKHIVFANTNAWLLFEDLNIITSVGIRVLGFCIVYFALLVFVLCSV